MDGFWQGGRDKQLLADKLLDAVTHQRMTPWVAIRQILAIPHL
jgi:hypothetical protein